MSPDQEAEVTLWFKQKEIETMGKLILILDRDADEDEECYNEIIESSEEAYASVMLTIQKETQENKFQFLKVVFDKTPRKNVELYMRIAWKCS